MFAILWTLLEIDPTCVRINQKFRFKSHSLHTFPILVNSHSDQNVVIESVQRQLISKRLHTEQFKIQQETVRHMHTVEVPLIEG